MKNIMITSLLATGIMLCGTVQAGNNPNTTRTLTNGIGSGTTVTGVPGSLPYNSHATRRNSRADVSLGNYRGGYSRSPRASSSTTSNPASSSRPSTIPASLPAQAQDHTPQSIGGSPASAGVGQPVSNASSGLSGSINTGVPASVTLPGSIPSTVSIPGGSVTPGSQPAPPVTPGNTPTAPELPALPALPASIPAAADAGLANRGKGRP